MKMPYVLSMLALCSLFYFYGDFYTLNSVTAVPSAHHKMHIQQMHSLSMFKHMSLINTSVVHLNQFARVPSLSGLDMYVWETKPKPIYMTYNNHLKWYTTNGNEMKVIFLLRYILTNTSKPADGAVVVDMGINDGYVAALGASYGYSVVAVDAQPECVRRFHLARAYNDWPDVHIYNNIVLSEEKTMMIPNGVCGGGSRFQGEKAVIHSDVHGIKEEGILGETAVKSVLMDDLVPSKTIIYFHLDVEGAELSVLHSALKLLKEKRIINLVWEFAPHRWAAYREQALADVQGFMKDFVCRDLRKMSWPITEDPLRLENVIRNWTLVYKKAEEEKRITDIWCYLR